MLSVLYNEYSCVIATQQDISITIVRIYTSQIHYALAYSLKTCTLFSCFLLLLKYLDVFIYLDFICLYLYWVPFSSLVKHVDLTRLHAYVHLSVIVARCKMYHDITHNNTVTGAKHKSDFEITKDTPYRALTRELWGVHWEDFVENWSCFNGTVLYIFRHLHTHWTSYIELDDGTY